VVLPDMLVMKNRARVAERRLAVGTFIRQILRDAQHSPRQRKTHANDQQKNNRDFHGGTRQNT
jgi:hypothetical protein